MLFKVSSCTRSILTNEFMRAVIAAVLVEVLKLLVYLLF